MALGNVDLRLTIAKVDINATGDSLAVGGGVEDVANGFAFGEGVVGHLEVLSVAGVGQSDQELTLGVGVEVLGGVALDPFTVPDLGLLTLSVDLLDNLVEV